jgi:hypothetical protein
VRPNLLIRAENIIFCSSAEHHSGGQNNLWSPSGRYGYSSPANPTEFSEIPTATSDNDIYCHSQYLSESPLQFCKRFDLYALGLVLLEIGSWKPLNRIFSHPALSYLQLGHAHVMISQVLLYHHPRTSPEVAASMYNTLLGSRCTCWSRVSPVQSGPLADAKPGEKAMALTLGENTRK